ncbi:hypothetical protein [Corynebacterium sp. NML130628]|uniref:hypothetical protein n=1 Tax=Corynebacterium sp. NML130628 TaxID=1906333 RepID=UPI0008FAFA97|nr:hypothetical protein [Corynebacterium sp. NML130628]OIR43093.1 hypothetical protein BJP07_07235 [Corynebacterium sp. NML130628]
MSPPRRRAVLGWAAFAQLADYRTKLTCALVDRVITDAERATAVGLDVGGVTRTCAALVAANPDSMSGKAKKAREYGIPIMSETHFARLLKSMEEPTKDTPVVGASSAVAPSVTAPEQFSWLTPEQSHAVGSSSSRIATAWIEQHPDRPLHKIADNLKPHHVPEATGRGIDRYLAMWSLEHPEMLNASADDLLDLHSVGPKRCSQLVEMVVDLAVDGVEEPVKVEAEAVAEKPEAVADPTPDELLAAAYSSAYVPSVSPSSAPVQPSSPGPLSVLEEKTNVGATIIKWSGIVGGSSFVLAVLLAVITGMTAEHPVADFLISISALSLIVAIFASPLALIRWLLNKRR